MWCWGMSVFHPFGEADTRPVAAHRAGVHPHFACAEPEDLGAASDHLHCAGAEDLLHGLRAKLRAPPRGASLRRSCAVLPPGRAFARWRAALRDQHRRWRRGDTLPLSRRGGRGHRHPMPSAKERTSRQRENSWFFPFHYIISKCHLMFSGKRHNGISLSECKL